MLPAESGAETFASRRPEGETSDAIGVEEERVGQQLGKECIWNGFHACVCCGCVCDDVNMWRVRACVWFANLDVERRHCYHRSTFDLVFHLSIKNVITSNSQKHNNKNNYHHRTEPCLVEERWEATETRPLTRRN
jgi:hypothetical protein